MTRVEMTTNVNNFKQKATKMVWYDKEKFHLEELEHCSI